MALICNSDSPSKAVKAAVFRYVHPTTLLVFSFTLDGGFVLASFPLFAVNLTCPTDLSKLYSQKDLQFTRKTI